MVADQGGGGAVVQLGGESARDVADVLIRLKKQFKECRYLLYWVEVGRRRYLLTLVRFGNYFG